jgi:HSP20 family protein
MANLIRRDNREVAQQRPRAGSGLFLDPFRVIDELLRWEPVRGMGGGETWGLAEFVPQFEVKETKDEYVIRADLPGVKESDLDISVTGNVIQVSGRREQERKEEGDRFYALERAYGQFTRSFSLPEGADPDRVTAELREGVLTVRIPKKPEVQPKRISVGATPGGNGEKAGEGSTTQGTTAKGGGEKGEKKS